MSAEFEVALLRTEKADGIKSLIAAAKMAAGYQARAEKAEAALARVVALADSWSGFGDKNSFRSTMVFASNELRAAMEPTL